MGIIKFTLRWKQGEDLTLESEREGANGKAIQTKSVIETKKQIEKRRMKEIMFGDEELKDPTYH